MPDIRGGLRLCLIREVRRFIAAVNGFGVGYSSPGLLQNLPIETEEQLVI